MPWSRIVFPVFQLLPFLLLQELLRKSCIHDFQKTTKLVTIVTESNSTNCLEK